MDLTITNTWFKKEERQLITYCSGGSKSQIDFILVRKQDRKSIVNVKVIPGEVEVTEQHRLVVSDINITPVEADRKVRVGFESRIKVWRLKEEEVRRKFEDKLSQETLEVEGSGEDIWVQIRDHMLKAAGTVCGWTKGQARHKETWWWNEAVEKASEWTKKCLNEFLAAKGSDREEEKKAALKLAKKASRREAAIAKRQKREEFAAELESDGGRKKVFQAAKRIARKNRDLVGANCIKDEDGKIVAGEDNLKRVWKQYMEKLLNEENEWDGEVACEKVEGPLREIEENEVRNAIRRTGYGKAGGPTAVVGDMFKAAGEVGVRWMTVLFNKVIDEGVMPQDWKISVLLPIFKGKGDPLTCGSYRGIKLLEHALKLFERVLAKRIRETVQVDEEQFGFMPGKGTTDAIFVVRQLQERMLARNRKLYLGFIDLEKAFDRVPREVVRWALRKGCVNEWLVRAVMATYDGARTAVKVGNGLSEDFEVKVGVHQGSVLSPLLFILVMQAVTADARKGLPWELMYADDLVLMAGTEEELGDRMKCWRNSLEKKGLKVNVAKTKVMVSDRNSRKEGRDCEWPCAVCGTNVRSHAIQCTKCTLWVHNRCKRSKKPVSAALAAQYKCPTCRRESRVTNVPELKELEIGGGETCEVVRKFCYLGDMIDAGGGADLAVCSRIRSGWKKFKDFAPILTDKCISHTLKARVYAACVRSVMLYGGETWPMKKELEGLLGRAEMRMIRWMCRVSLREHRTSEELRRNMGLESITEVLSRERLRWYGHVMRKDDTSWVKRCMTFDVGGKRPRGRPLASWEETVRNDRESRGLKEDDVSDRRKWRRLLYEKGRPSNGRRKRPLNA